MNTPYRILKELEEVDNIIEFIDESENIDKNYILSYKKQMKSIINKSFNTWVKIIQSKVVT
jgi:hypothetical protein